MHRKDSGRGLRAKGRIVQRQGCLRYSRSLYVYGPAVLAFVIVPVALYLEVQWSDEVSVSDSSPVEAIQSPFLSTFSTRCVPSYTTRVRSWGVRGMATLPY